MLAVISDTHGLVRPEVLSALYGSEAIIHAGDVGSQDVLLQLERIAPVYAVRGNVDRGAWATSLPEHSRIQWRGCEIHLTHMVDSVGAAELSGVDLLVCGHSHVPHAGYHLGMRYLNPGSIGPRRFRLPVAFATLEDDSGRIRLTQTLLDCRGIEHDLGPGWGDWRRT